MFIHEICHFSYDGHDSEFLGFLDGMIGYVGDLIPVSKDEKIFMAVEIIKRKIEKYLYFDEDESILNMIEISAKVNGLDVDDLLDKFFE